MNFEKIKTLREFEKNWDLFAQEIQNRDLSSFSNKPEDKEKRISLSKTSVIEFGKIYFPEYFSDESAPFHKEWDALTSKENELFMVEASRGFGKSTFFTFVDIIHGFLFEISHFTIISSYNEDKSKIFTARVLLELLYNPRINADFKYNFTKKDTGDIQINKNGFRFCLKAISIGQNARGEVFFNHRPDKAVIDDIQDRKRAKSKKFVRNCIEWIMLDLIPALNPKNYTAKIIGTPLNKKCVISELKKGSETRKPIKCYSYPAIKNDKSQWESRFSLKLLNAIKESIGTLFFNQEYLLIPISIDEEIFKEEWIKFYNNNDIENTSFEIILSFTDSSLTAKGDYKATVLIGVKEGKYYILSARIRRETVSKMIDGMYSMYKEDKPVLMYYEDYTDRTNNKSIIKEAFETKELEYNFNLPLKAVKNSINKEARIEGTLTSIFENGKILFNKNDKDQEILIEQILSFPDGKNDDGLDALEGAVRFASEYTRKLGSLPKVLKIIRQSKILKGFI